MNITQTIILALIEGLTEFLPVSSTGHLILASSAMKIHEDEFVKTFEIFIQLGAILAIALMYIKRFFQGMKIYAKLFVAFIPTAIVGFFAYDFIKSYLFNPIVVSLSLIIGGIILIWIDKKVISKESEVESLVDIAFRNAFYIGLMQCFSMIPGTSRAASTIIGGVFNRLDKKQATEFSFLLAIPTMIAATGYDLFKTSINFNNQEIVMLTLGLATAFVSAWLAVKIFLRIVENYGFKHFGYYRIIVGLLFLYIMA
ncbi:undecaprenyl-diphosphate phosphatase [Algoriphagus winogradskyi]|uniref:Undecaprenyl-diphosphatase n=1 Tax=Algoriphagus winogradskyi TaxID=237017 RepID=A0ABY1PLZ3_9BACT|nr:undecaprenyl-diphosphate phosphatase [Algoriphagus winogradskyi]SMP36454.1 Undecaprenyl-diphosphatase [Algoriphagus winogradskyi]